MKKLLFILLVFISSFSKAQTIHGIALTGQIATNFSDSVTFTTLYCGISVKWRTAGQDTITLTPCRSKWAAMQNPPIQLSYGFIVPVYQIIDTSSNFPTATIIINKVSTQALKPTGSGGWGFTGLTTF